MPTHIELGGDGLLANPTCRHGKVITGTLKGLPKIMCFDRMAHILHPGLMKFQHSLQCSGFMEDSSYLAMDKVVKDVSKGGLQIHSHGYTKGWRLFSWLGLPFEKGFKDFDVVLKGVWNNFEIPSLSCFLQFQVAVERCDRWLDRFQVARVLGLLDLCDVE